MNSDHLPPVPRRTFLKQSAAAALILGLSPRYIALAQTPAPAPGGSPEAAASLPADSFAQLGWKMSVQHYTYRSFNLFEAMEKSAAVGLRYFEVRTYLKLDARWPDSKCDDNMPPEARAAFKTRLDELGLTLPTVYADFTGKLEQAQHACEFWKELGAQVIVAEPPMNSLDMLEKVFDQCQMRLALHNHQKGKSAYWSPDIVLEACANRGPSVGACADVGQWARSDLDPVACLQKVKDRLFNVHMKDVLKKGDLDSRNTVLGEGQAECVAVLAELKRLGYQGILAIDFEHETPALQKDMAKNVAFLKEHSRRLVSP